MGLLRTVRAIAEPEPGAAWRRIFEEFWPAYQAWFSTDGLLARPTYLEASRRLESEMPELYPIYERLVDLAGGGDSAARFLALYRPPSHLFGCSQAVLPLERGGPVLVRNYDYSPKLWEGVILKTRWNDRAVFGMSDCLWGLLDGINDRGLAVSLAFGGRKEVGNGFAMPLILRYILETCDRAEQGVRVLLRVRSHLAYNVTLIDREGHFSTVRVFPGGPPQVMDHPVATNHQGEPAWAEYQAFTGSILREEHLKKTLSDRDLDARGLSDSFLLAPLYSKDFEHARGTLYTASYYPREGRALYRWPSSSLSASLERFEETELQIEFG